MNFPAAPCCWWLDNNTKDSIFIMPIVLASEHAMETTATPIRTVPFLERLRFRRGDRIGTLVGMARRHGDVARVPWWGGIVKANIVSSADMVHEILVEQADAFVKGYGLSYFARPLLGNGLLTSERDFHRRQRRMMAPAFVHKRIADYATVIGQRAEAAQQGFGDGAVVDFSAAMMRMTLEIVGATLFGAEVGDEAEEIHAALTAAMEQATSALRAVVPIPPSWPTPGNRRGQKAIARLDRTVYRLIEERRREGGDRGDFLSMLLLAQDEDDGSVMTDKQVRDEAMNIFLAGHETTANALAWTFYLLAQHPAIRERVEREADEVLGGRTPTLADLPRLPFALQVFKEAMRLYPPAFVVARRATRDVIVGGHRMARNELAIINIVGMHRRPSYYAEPDRFDPERWSPENEKSLNKRAFLPFGAGPRVCIGNHFAMLEGHLAVAALAQRVSLDLAPGSARIEPEPLITLRPRGGIPMLVRRRGAVPHARFRRGLASARGMHGARS
ncbi:MAG: cytochrome P450 [Minicystis sp.]